MTALKIVQEFEANSIHDSADMSYVINALITGEYVYHTVVGYVDSDIFGH